MTSAVEPPPADHGLLQRVEIFSDVVLGFCLAELGLSLSLPVGPGHVIEVLTKPWGLVAFVWTFGTICLLWVRNNQGVVDAPLRARGVTATMRLFAGAIALIHAMGLRKPTGSSE